MNDQLTLGGFPRPKKFWWIFKGGKTQAINNFKISMPYVFLEDAISHLKDFGINRTFSDVEMGEIQNLGFFYEEDYSIFLSDDGLTSPPHLRKDTSALYPDKEAYDYATAQNALFERYLPEITKYYAGQYVLFENGTVIASDFDEENLLSRVWNSDFVKTRESIFVEKVPSAPAKNMRGVE